MTCTVHMRGKVRVNEAIAEFKMLSVSELIQYALHRDRKTYLCDEYRMPIQIQILRNTKILNSEIPGIVPGMHGYT